MPCDGELPFFNLFGEGVLHFQTALCASTGLRRYPGRLCASTALRRYPDESRFACMLMQLTLAVVSPALAPMPTHALSAGSLGGCGMNQGPSPDI